MRIEFLALTVFVAAAAVPVAGAGLISFGPASANLGKFADVPEEAPMGWVEHVGGRLVLEYQAEEAGTWDGAAEVILRDSSGRTVAGVRAINYATRGGLFAEVVLADGQARRVRAVSGRQEFDLPAGRYALTGWRATYPTLPEGDVLGAPIPQAVNLQVAVVP